MKDDKLEIKVGEDFAVRSQTSNEKKAWNDADIPDYTIKIKLTDDQKKELKETCFKEFEALKDERIALGLDKKFKEREDSLKRYSKPVNAGFKFGG